MGLFGGNKDNHIFATDGKISNEFEKFVNELGPRIIKEMKDDTDYYLGCNIPLNKVNVTVKKEQFAESYVSIRFFIEKGNIFWSKKTDLFSVHFATSNYSSSSKLLKEVTIVYFNSDIYQKIRELFKKYVNRYDRLLNNVKIIEKKNF